MREPATRVLCDWGSTRMRAFLEEQGSIVERLEGPGIGLLGFLSAEEALLSTICPWQRRYRLGGIFLCGMVGARDGLREVPYVCAPIATQAWARSHRTLHLEDLALTVAAGVKARNFHGVLDVIRGEETQIFGAIALHTVLGEGSRLFVLPGTHSKWVQTQVGEIVRAQTYLTGELFALLCNASSLLRAAVPGDEVGDGFEAGLERAAQCDLAANLFETRSAQLTAGRSASWAKAFLSGVLLGSEVRSIRASGALAPRGAVTVIGDTALGELYRRALSAGGIEADFLDGECCAIAGLRVLAMSVSEES
jgi:2-dehydro-3-deoxygalactonokinase